MYIFYLCVFLRFEKKRDALVINPTELTDVGTYSMLAKTKTGDRWCNHTLIVGQYYSHVLFHLYQMLYSWYLLGGG